jgi:hypothetical protein
LIDSHICINLLWINTCTFISPSNHFDIYMSKGATLSYDVAHRKVRS